MHPIPSAWLHPPSASALEVKRSKGLRRAGAWLSSLQKNLAPDNRIVVESGDASFIHHYAASAAAPRVARYELGHAWRIEVHAPGATTKNTTATWDETAETLVIAVWCGTPPERNRRSFPRPEAAWVRRFWLPAAELSRAEARVHRGVITVEVPKRGISR